MYTSNSHFSTTPDFALTVAALTFRPDEKARLRMGQKLRIAVIGAGRWGPNLIRNFQIHPDCEVTWICDADVKRLDILSKNYLGIRTTTDPCQVFESDSADAVVISSPTATHFELAKTALARGKHTFVEKPLATAPPMAWELVKLAECRGLKLMVGHVFLFHPAIRFVKDLLERKALGEIHYLYAIRTNLGPIRNDVNALWDLAPHDLAMILYLVSQRPASVVGTGSSFINPPVEDVVFASLRYPGGVLANLHVSWLDPKKVRQLVIVGSEKMLIFDDMSPEHPVRIFDKNVGPDLSAALINDTLHHFRKSIVEGKVDTPEIGFSEPLKNECDAFVQWILDNRTPVSTGAFGADVVTLLQGIDKSISLGGQPVSVDIVSSLGNTQSIPHRLS